MWLPEASSGACTGVLASGQAPAIQTRCGPPPLPSPLDQPCPVRAVGCCQVPLAHSFLWGTPHLVIKE